MEGGVAHWGEVQMALGCLVRRCAKGEACVIDWASTEVWLDAAL
jgi:hypothetical protein